MWVLILLVCVNFINCKEIGVKGMGMFMEGVSKKKDDITGVVGSEVGKMLAKIDLSEELNKILKTHKIHFDIKVDFEPRKPKKKEPKDG